MQNLSSTIGKLLCWMGFHDFQVLSRTFSFGETEGVEKVECNRCGMVATRRG